MTVDRAIARRLLTVLLTAAASALVAGCGGESEPSRSPVGTPENPAVTRSFPGGGEPTERSRPRGETTQRPGYDRIVKSQQRRPRERLTPCGLVTRPQARAILGAAILEPREAPQGPTCIYRTRAPGQFVTLAVQSAPLADLRRNLRDVQRFEIASRRAYCGRLGQRILYVALGRDRVLTVVASCATARRFAAAALSSGKL